MLLSAHAAEIFQRLVKHQSSVHFDELCDILLADNNNHENKVDLLNCLTQLEQINLIEQYEC